MVGIEGWGAGVGVVLLGLLLSDGWRRPRRGPCCGRRPARTPQRARLSGFAMTSGSTSCKAGRRRTARFSRRVMQARTIVRQNTFETLRPIASQMVAFGSPVVALLVGQAASGAWPSPANAWAYWFLAMQNLDMFNQLPARRGLGKDLSEPAARCCLLEQPALPDQANARAAQGDAELRLAGAEYVHTTAAAPPPRCGRRRSASPPAPSRSSLGQRVAERRARAGALRRAGRGRQPPIHRLTPTAPGRQGLKAYRAQRPVLFLGTVRDNIVAFGVDAVAYQSAIAACGLDVDLRLLADWTVPP